MQNIDLLLGPPTMHPADPLNRLVGNRCSSLKPYFNFVAIRIENKSVRQTRAEFASRCYGAACVHDRCPSCVDVFRTDEPEAEMNNSPCNACACGPLLKREDIELPGTQLLNCGIAAEIFTYTEDRLIERQRPGRIEHGNCDMAKSVRLDHGTLSNKIVERFG